MEMRREGARWLKRGGAVERGVLAAYWLFLGYGLRASRALAVFAVVVALRAAVFATYGFVDLDRTLDDVRPESSQTTATRPPPHRLPETLGELRDAFRNLRPGSMRSSPRCQFPPGVSRGSRRREG